MGVDGVYARTGGYEQVVDGLAGLISRQREPGTEVFRFPPVMSRRQLEKSGYLKSFPHLLGCVSCLHGSEAEIRAVGRFERGQRLDVVAWRRPIWCSVRRPAIRSTRWRRAAARSRRTGLLFDVSCDCFRHEPSERSRPAAVVPDARIRLHRIAGADRRFPGALDGARAQRIADRLGLPYRIEQASDPFFGRGGKLMAISQVEQSLKFELLIPVRSVEQPTACMSFNYHRDHFGTTWGLRDQAGETAHTGCVAFGMDRLAVALFGTHGVEVARWPASVREVLGL